jgi:hypothetical protein
MANAATYATYIKGITGKSSEATPPDITLSATYNHVNASNPHSGSQPLDGDLTALAALAGTGWAQRIGTNSWQLSTPTAADVGAAPVANPTFTGALTTGTGLTHCQGSLGVDGSARFDGAVGFYTNTPVSRINVVGSRGGNAALANLLTALNSLGLITNSTTA